MSAAQKRSTGPCGPLQISPVSIVSIRFCHLIFTLSLFIEAAGSEVITMLIHLGQDMLTMYYLWIVVPIYLCLHG